MAGFRQTAGVIRNGAKGIDGNRSANKGKHSQRGNSNAIGTAYPTGNEKANSNQQNREENRTGADCIALGDDKASPSVAISASLRVGL